MQTSIKTSVLALAALGALALSGAAQAEQPTYEDQDPGRAEVAAVNLPIEKIDIAPLLQKYY